MSGEEYKEIVKLTEKVGELTGVVKQGFRDIDGRFKSLEQERDENCPTGKRVIRTLRFMLAWMLAVSAVLFAMIIVLFGPEPLIKIAIEAIK